MKTNTINLNEKPILSQPYVFCPHKVDRKTTSPSRPEAGSETVLIRKYLPLVKTVVGRMQMVLPPHLDTEDLLSAGLVGLLAAIRQFNVNIGSPFESYARLRIRGAILDELRRTDWVPRSVHRSARRVQQVTQHLEQHLRRPPTAVEMAAELGISLKSYHRLLHHIQPATFVCLDAVINSESGDTPTSHEMMADPSQANPADEVARRERSQQLLSLLNRLPPTQKKVLALYYYEDMRLREIAEVLRLTESRICQIHAQAILALKTQLENLPLN